MTIRLKVNSMFQSINSEPRGTTQRGIARKCTCCQVFSHFRRKRVKLSKHSLIFKLRYHCGTGKTGKTEPAAHGSWLCHGKEFLLNVWTKSEQIKSSDGPRPFNPQQTKTDGGKHTRCLCSRVNNDAVQEQDCGLGQVLVSRSWTPMASGSEALRLSRCQQARDRTD